MAAVQFYGVEQVMNAAENFGCPAWAIFIEGNMFTKFEGGTMSESLTMLQQVLEALERTQSNGLYTIKFFEVPKDGTVKINAKTVCDGGSFRFKLIDPQEVEQGRFAVGSTYNLVREMQQEIKQLRDELKDAKEELEEADKEESIGSAVINLLQQPQQLAQVVSLFRSVLVPGAPAINGQIPQMAGMTDPQPGAQDLDRLETAIDTLQQADPQLVAHLEKLAQMAQEKPDQFQQLINFL